MDAFEYFETADAADMEIIDPQDGPTGLYLTIASRDSELFRQANVAHQKRLRSLQRQYKGNERIPDDEKADAVREWLADIVTGWRRDERAKVTLPEHSRANVIRLLRKSFIADQVLAFTVDAANFMRRPSSN